MSEHLVMEGWKISHFTGRSLEQNLAQGGAAI